MSVSQINLVVSNLERSKSFYEALGCEMRPIIVPGSEAPQAWQTMTGFAPVCIHTVEFAAWWDSSGPGVNPGSITTDIAVDDRSLAVDLIEVVSTHGGRVLQALTDMPWGEAYAIFEDPDGYRWGMNPTRP